MSSVDKTIQDMIKNSENDALDIIQYVNRGLFMARQAKDFKNLNCKVDIKVSNELEKFIEETNLSKTATVEKSLMMYIEHYNKTGKI